jgi:DNA (cytosine-5)-methyltransferase 1
MSIQGGLYRVVDLFAGCGGLSRGLERTGRFRTEFAVELAPHPAATFHANLRNSAGDATPVFSGDIVSLVGDSARLWRELHKAEIHEAGEVDLLVGGPPCQGFSRNGVRRYRADKQSIRFYDEPRNYLYKAFLQMVEILQPRAILVENVREFLNADGGRFSSDLFDRLEELGYVAQVHKLCAADYGVPQMRWRAFVLAARPGISLRLSPPTHSADPRDRKGLLERSAYVTVREAIADLPSPTAKHSNERTPYPSDTSPSAFAEAMRSGLGGVLNHVDRPLSAKTLARVQAVGNGRMKDIDPSLQTKKFYGSAYGRLWWDRPSLTITTWVYSVGSGRFAHPSEDRGITMREAARLQSFDDDFVFPMLINPVSQMIGNAVPPVLAKALGCVIASGLDGTNKEEDPAVSQREEVAA